MLTDEGLIGAMERVAKFLDPQLPAEQLDVDDAVVVMTVLRSLAKKYRVEQKRPVKG